MFLKLIPWHVAAPFWAPPPERARLLSLTRRSHILQRITFGLATSLRIRFQGPIARVHRKPQLRRPAPLNPKSFLQ